MKRFVVLIFLCLFGVSVMGQPTEDESKMTGPEIAAEIRQMAPAENANWTGRLKIRGKDRKITTLPIRCRVEHSKTNWTVIYSVDVKEAPGEELRIIHSPDLPNEYYYAAAGTNGSGGALKKLGPAEIDRPFAGSDFWISDLGFEFYHWPDQKRLRGEVHRSRSCHVLESRNPDAKPGSYARVVSWIDKESNGLLSAEAYGPDKKVIKDFAVGSVKKVNGKWELQDMDILTRKAGTRTTIEFDLPKKGD